MTSNDEFAEKVRDYPISGLINKPFSVIQKSGSWYYQVEGPGFKCNMDNIHAAIGRIQLRKLDNFIDKRRKLQIGTTNSTKIYSKTC